MPKWEKKANANGIHVLEGTSFFHQDISGSSPHLFTVIAGTMHAVCCKYVPAVDMLGALTENKQLSPSQYTSSQVLQKVNSKAQY